MANSIIKVQGKYRVHLHGLPFHPNEKQIFFYDPSPDSVFSKEVEAHLQEIKDFLGERDYEFYCFTDMAKQLSEEFVRYRFPNWNGQPLNKVGNDLLKCYFSEEYQCIGASFIRLFDAFEDVYSCFQLYDINTYSLEEQLEFYRDNLKDDYGISCSIDVSMVKEDTIRYSVTKASDSSLFPVYEKKLCIADKYFDSDSKLLTDEIREMVERLHQEGISEFVLRCMVPVEEKLSRIIITPKCEILLPDYGMEPVQMSPLPKAVFLLFLKHDEGIYFKELMDYREELKSIYTKLTNRISAAVVANSLDAVTDPTANSINEKCSRIREAFVGRMDERIAQHYFVTGEQGELKRITLPRNLVEWQCKL